MIIAKIIFPVEFGLFNVRQSLPKLKARSEQIWFYKTLFVPDLLLFLISASNYIISGSSGFETAKACAVVEDTPRSNENQISIENNYDLPVSVKPGKNLFLSCKN